MKVKLIIILNLFLFSLVTWGQEIESNDKIILTGNTPEQRKLKNIANPVNETNAVSENFFLSGLVNYAIASGANDTLNLTIYPGPSVINPGFILNFTSPIVNDNNVYIEINSSGVYYPLSKKGIDPLDTSDIVIGQVVSIIFDGTRFQVFSDLNRSCPNGFIKVNAEYCIEPVENNAKFFWAAIKDCGLQNSRVCSWGEWYYACQQSVALGILDMTDNWEWIDGGGNSLGWTTPPTTDTGLQSGDAGDCTNIMSSITDTTHNHYRADPKPYRCCYSLIR